MLIISKNPRFIKHVTPLFFPIWLRKHYGWKLRQILGYFFWKTTKYGSAPGPFPLFAWIDAHNLFWEIFAEIPPNSGIAEFNCHFRRYAL